MGPRYVGKIVVLLMMLVVFLPACKSQSKGDSPILLKVEGREVSLEQFRQRFSKSLPQGQKLSEEERKELEQSFLVQLIDQELTLAQADRMAITVSTDEHQQAIEEAKREYPAGTFENQLRERDTSLQEWSTALKRDLLIEKVVRQEVYANLAVSEEEIAAYYDENVKAFDRPAQVRARQIVVSTEEEGQKVLGLLRQGEEFAAVARQYSLSPDAAEGGDLGFFAKGEMPAEFEQTVFKLVVGRLSDLVKSEYGFHVFLVEEKREAAQLTIDEVRDEIRGTLLEAKKDEVYQQWLRDLRARATIEMDWSLLK